MNRKDGHGTHNKQMGLDGGRNAPKGPVSSEDDGPSCTLAGVRTCIQSCVLQSRQRTRDAARGTPPPTGAAVAPPPPNPFDDLLLLEALRRGDAEARVMLLERYEPFIERLIAGVLGFRVDIPDIVTQVFVLALERIPQLKETTVLPSWIGALAVLAARDHIRRDRWRRWLGRVVPRTERAADGPATSPECCELLRHAYRALAALPEDERIAFSLRHIADLEPAEVAGVCATDAATIERRIARGMERFRAQVERSPVLRAHGRAAPAAPVPLSRRPAREV